MHIGQGIDEPSAYLPGRLAAIAPLPRTLARRNGFPGEQERRPLRM